ncbi:hypothetical protein [Paenibacillus sp. OAE614]|uniref:hypothetical protein n=1 Tax=Paenibacillus sp. OAE614 TaxID=2663804 RepID=UPI0033993C68
MSNGEKLGGWLIPIIVMIAFALFWEGWIYLIMSTLLMWVVSVPLWWFLIERHENYQRAANFSGSLPLIILAYAGCVLIPQIIILAIKNFIINKLRERR